MRFIRAGRRTAQFLIGQLDLRLVIGTSVRADPVTLAAGKRGGESTGA